MPWTDFLTDPITLKDGRVLQTLADAARLITGLSEARQAHAWVLYAAELLLKAADAGDVASIKEATRQVERALKREGIR